MNGDQNLWIIKPGHQSRGRGIVIMSNYYEILKYIRESRGRNWFFMGNLDQKTEIKKFLLKPR